MGLNLFQVSGLPNDRHRSTLGVTGMSVPKPAGGLSGKPEFCPRYHQAVELIGRRWTGAVLRVLLSGTHRFGEVRAAIPGLSDRLLSERLRELEVEGIIQR